MPDDFSMDSYVAMRDQIAGAEVQPAASTPAATPAAPAPAQDSAASGTATQDPSAADPAAAQPQPPQQPEPPERRRARGVQKRFDELTQARLTAERQAEALLQANRDLIARLAPPQAQPAQQPQQPPVDAQPREEDFPGDYRGYLDARAKWVARQETAAVLRQADEQRQRQAEEQRQQQERQQQLEHVGQVLTEFDARKEAFVKEAPDYDAAIETLDAIQLGPQQAPMLQTLLLRPDSAKVLYHLGKNPQEAQRIASLPPALQGAAIGEFAATVNRAPRPSNAPPPGRPASGMHAPASTSPPTGSMDDYARWRAQQMRA